MLDGVIPRTMDQLTPLWLTAALRERGIIRDASVTAVRIESIGAGSGFLGTWRVCMCGTTTRRRSPARGRVRQRR